MSKTEPEYMCTHCCAFLRRFQCSDLRPPSLPDKKVEVNTMRPATPVVRGKSLNTDFVLFAEG